jgi:hypothetical protein
MRFEHPMTLASDKIASDKTINLNPSLTLSTKYLLKLIFPFRSTLFSFKNAAP